MSEVSVYPTFELSTPLNAVAPAPTKHVSDSDAPSTQYLSSSSPAETFTIVSGADDDNTKSSDSVAAVATAAVALIPHCHPSAARRAGEHSSFVLSSEAEQSLGDVTSNLHIDEGVAMLPTPLNLMSRRATLPFTADTTNHGDGGANASEGAFRFALPTLVGRSETLYAQDFTSCAAHTRVAFVAEREPSDAHQQLRVDGRNSCCPAAVGKVAADDVPAAGRGRLSLSDSLISVLGAARDDGRARQAMDVACTPWSSTGAASTPLTTAGMSHAGRYFSSLCAKWRPGAIFSVDSEAASSSSLCLCAMGNDTDPSFPSCGCSCLTPRPNRNSASHLLSATMPPLALPSGVPAAASTPAAPAQLLVQRFSSSTPRDVLSATTIPIVAAATSSASDGDEAHLPALFLDTGAGADAAPHTDREGTEVDAERALSLSGDPAAATCILAEIPSTLHAAFTTKRGGGASDERIPTCPGVSGTGAGTNTEREGSVNQTPNHVLVQPNTPLPTDITREICTSCAVTGITSKAAQLSSSMHLLGLHERKSVSASLSAPRPLQQHGPCGGDTAPSKLECPLELTKGSQEQKRGFLLPFSPRDATTRGGEHRLSSISGDSPAATADVSLTRSPLSPPWPPLTRARRRGSADTPEEMKLLPKEGAEVNRLSWLDTHDEEETLTCTSQQLSRSVCRELDRTTEGCRGLCDTVLAAPATPRSRSAGMPMGSSGDAAAASVSPACAFFLPFLQSRLSKWLRWVSHRYHGVVRRTSGVTGEEGSLPKRDGAFQKRACNGSSGCRSFFPPEASAEAVDNGSADFHSVRLSKGDIPHPSLALSLSESLINCSLEGELSRDTWAQEALSSLTTPWNGRGNSSWLSVGLQAEQRGVVCASGELMQLRSSIAAAAPPPPSSSSRDASLPTSSGKRRCVSPTPQSLSLSAESLTASQIFSGSAPQWPSRGLVGLLNSSASFACLSGDYHSPPLHSSLGCRSRMSGSTASTIVDDRHRDTLYRLFHQPPSSLMGSLTECYEAYQAMVETFSKGHHSLSWGELILLLRPEDCLDYRALFPPQHLLTFEDFVEFVEVLSVRYRR
ncbi:hypothetical protein CUR178_00424 [Leishmania enriettii]|uniref:Uncharacterized protein n=1 Tax=Leishmania enriettii TaxID=5663 RepID=A0A836KB39_LEIEN|nr:hypothetical protein CUR178_00424 [Leishmania enriettii]